MTCCDSLENSVIPGWNPVDSIGYPGKVLAEEELLACQGDDEMTKTGAKTCFECGNEAYHDHHIIPKSMGGTKTVPLCTECHAKVHGRRAMASGELIKAGIAKAKARGVKIGGSNKGRLLSVKPEQVEIIKTRKAEGVGVSHIARELGVSRPTIYRVLSA